MSDDFEDDSVDEGVIPDESEQLDQLQPEDSLVDRGVADTLDEGYTAPERWSPAEGFGNTPAEEAEGESLDQRLRQEEPDPWNESRRGGERVDDGEVGDERAGRLVDAPTDGDGEDVEAEMLGSEVGIDGGAASAEEAAVHVVDEEDD